MLVWFGLDMLKTINANSTNLTQQKSFQPNSRKNQHEVVGWINFIGLIGWVTHTPMTIFWKWGV